ncbi:MAG: hypothetical protein M1814_004248 [Vezdaea aestivalis]|nr:MAG: hypothetical protein M1814_004248 [Vezdaea aestivalis]
MGVPKFFRWMSERYPAISQLIAENRIPEFDCLYLDMNGIIHNCTHNDSDSPTFRMTEDKMFIAIFNYIEHLFGKIKPKKIFFMAIDGVAPRAKMNQQRARRFRTALDAEKAKEKAVREGVEMPKEEAFDSNCITPGTEFMAKLTQQLNYFVSKKVTEDVDWQGVEVVLSGHEVPGEGEHKIMEYIRLAKAQPGYDPNVRHCLYGLDADLIMLGLLSHDPHFCLLREEVTFGRQSKAKSKELERQNFYLMHLCIVREYLELEFQELKEPGVLGFPFDTERIIDDFILMAFFVGNDFLPNLPNLHINEGALALMFKMYKSVLPKAKGYINEDGVINIERLAILLDELSPVEFRFFEMENSDATWFKGKQQGKVDVMQNTKKDVGKMVLSTVQKGIYKEVKSFVKSKGKPERSLHLSSALPARDRKFTTDLADRLHLPWKTVEDESGDRHLVIDFVGDPDDQEEESEIALGRIFKQYDTASIVDVSVEEAKEQMELQYEKKFQTWKNDYYADKFEWGLDDAEQMQALTENYVEGLQWVLFYYYRGVASWPWFYKYHYSPMISDVKKGLKANLKFELGQPFRPYQQLMGVLPDRSKSIVPSPYWDLMTNPTSPIIDFYPRDFELDMNGKKMEWEAVVKIPFIDEKRLLSAMATKDSQLSKAEHARNDFGVTLKFSYSSETDFTYPSSLLGIFPDLPHCKCVANTFELPTLEGLHIHHGLMKGARLGKESLAGFPSLKTLDHTGALAFHSVNVFSQDSRNESMVITLLDSAKSTNVESAKQSLGKRVHVGYPFLQEALVTRVTDELFSYVLPTSGSGPPITVPHGPQDTEQFDRKASRLEGYFSKRLGIVVGFVKSITHVEMLKGLQKTDDGATIKEFADIPGIDKEYLSQTIVQTVFSEDPRFVEKAALPIEEEFPVGSRAFFLGEYSYGRPLEVIKHRDNKADVWVSALRSKEPEFGREIAAAAEKLFPYTPSYAVARSLNLNPLVLSKLTASFSVIIGDSRTNLGLNLKFEAKKLKVLGYSRRGETGWEFTEKAIKLIQQYMINFPDFIAGIQRKPQGDMYYPEDFYPADVAPAKMKEIQAWLKSIEAKSFDKVPLDANQLDSEIVLRIEKEADHRLQTAPKPQGKKVHSVPRSALLKPADAEQRLGNQYFRIGDRAVYVQDSGRVPIATRGTVVGVTRTARTTLLDIVFDSSFMSGTSLGDRCSPFRGSTVPTTSVLNLSIRQLIFESKASTVVNPVPNGGRTNYGIPTGPGGRGQYAPASAPAPLRGSFRGAVTGQNQRGPNPRQRGYASGLGGRGRGADRGSLGGVTNGVNRLSFQDQNDGLTENARWIQQQQIYSAVPPPANLDPTARGRGGPRGRGGRGRGRVAPRAAPGSQT